MDLANFAYLRVFTYRVFLLPPIPRIYTLQHLQSLLIIASTGEELRAFVEKHHHQTADPQWQSQHQGKQPPGTIVDAQKRNEEAELEG